MAAIAQFAKDNSGVLYLDRVSSECRVEPLDKYKRELAGCLGGHALMGPLFGVPLVLVEGDDDYRIWSQVPRHHVVSLAAIPAHGEEIFQYQRNLEGLFEALRENSASPAGFALLDGDKPKPTEAQAAQKHVKFIQLNCHEAENLYLTDEVLALMGIDWNTATTRVTERAHEFPDRADRLKDLNKIDRQSADVKDLIYAISLLLDSKSLHWTIRVAQVIGRTRPSGQVGGFLGDEVVNALWGKMPQ